MDWDLVAVFALLSVGLVIRSYFVAKYPAPVVPPKQCRLKAGDMAIEIVADTDEGLRDAIEAWGRAKK